MFYCLYCLNKKKHFGFKGNTEAIGVLLNLLDWKTACPSIRHLKGFGRDEVKSHILPWRVGREPFQQCALSANERHKTLRT